jgi:hypothetical protein
MVIQVPLPVDSVIRDILPPIAAFGKAPGWRDAPPVDANLRPIHARLI